MPSFTLGHFIQPSGSRAAALGDVGSPGGRQGGCECGGATTRGHSGSGSGGLQACFSPISGDAC